MLKDFRQHLQEGFFGEKIKSALSKIYSFIHPWNSSNTRSGERSHLRKKDSKNLIIPTLKKNLHNLKGFATFWEFSFYRQKKVADYEYHSLFAEKIHFHT